MRYNEFKFERDDFIKCLDFMKLAGTNSDIIFMHTDVIFEGKAIDSFNYETPHPKNGFPPKERIWITSHSDHPITNELLKRYEGQFDHWFAINSEVKDPKVTTIPLGLNYYSETDYNLLYSIIQQPRKEQENKAFMSFNLHTCLGERGAVHAILSEHNWITWKYPISMEEYYTNIRNHPFTICPRGNGYDTHRFWEALYLGSIPVVRENPVINAFKDVLPICIVKNWFDLDEEYLEMEYERIMSCDTYDDKYLKQSYWNEKIQAQVECAKV